MIKAKIATAIVSTALATTVGGAALLNFNGTTLEKTTNNVSSFMESSNTLMSKSTTTINSLISKVHSLENENSSLKNKVSSENNKINLLEKQIVELQNSKTKNQSTVVSSSKIDNSKEPSAIDITNNKIIKNNENIQGNTTNTQNS